MPKPNMKFNPLKARLRATFNGDVLAAAGSRLESIDTEKEILHGVQITLEGEALGHGIWLDREFCDAVSEQGNATGDVGLKVRYGHPAMCSDALGTELGRAKNFRVVDFKRTIDGQEVTCAGVIADVQILQAAHSAPQGDIAAHVLAMAKEDPKQFGQSIVFTYGDWVVKDADGNRHSYNEEVRKPFDEWLEKHEHAGDIKKCAKEEELIDEWNAKSADGKHYAVFGKLHGSDFTDTPAVTDGIFSTNTLAEEATEMLEDHPQLRQVLLSKPENVIEFLKRSELFDALAPAFESARVSGLQAAKDKEINALKTELAALRPDFDALKAAKESADTALAAFFKEAGVENLVALQAKLAEQTAALDAANANVKQLQSKLAETEKSLSATKADLSAQIERYRDQLGAALHQPDGKPTYSSNSERIASGMKIV